MKRYILLDGGKIVSPGSQKIVVKKLLPNRPRPKSAQKAAAGPWSSLRGAPGGVQCAGRSSGAPQDFKQRHFTPTQRNKN